MNRRLAVAFLLLLVLGSALAIWLRSPPPAKSSATIAQPAATGKGVEPVAAPASSMPPAPPVARVPPALAAELSQLLALAEVDERFRRLDEFWRRWFARDREGVFVAIA